MGGGKKARGRTDRAKHEEAAAQKIANGEEPSTALREENAARRLPRDPGARQEATLIDPCAPVERLAARLVDFVARASIDITSEAYLWMENNEFGVLLADDGEGRIFESIDTIALLAAAKGDDPKAHMSLMLLSNTTAVGSHADRKKWADNALTQCDPTNIEWSSIKFWFGLQGVSILLGLRDEPSPGALTQSMDYLQTAAECGSATAQHILGMIKLWSRSRFKSLDTTSFVSVAGRWICMAAKQGVKEAQFELGKMFGCADFGGNVYNRLARKYTRQASAQGHDEAT
eukprot:CAMPEP_0181395306 /NCGR_PEP_ID=MMETSP1106-20121128/28265_1 /TAXON_ID=81844 /ORGANISM="Mantoniella antarctica, Strain SL-175" /LENGTH=287 /DNA_ID=CAMNT_0023516909 /DNA_START=465 /DNA_END=1325 /DNA_ORIENTATION=+